VYSSTVCFNHEDLLCCSCDCRAGCEGNGKVLCVHILPLLYQITHFLFDGLADSILVEYANRWKSIQDYEFIKSQHDEIKNNVMLLKTASQQYHINEDEQEIHEILENFLVGTSKPKNHRSTTDFSLLGPLRHQDFSSTRKLARQKLRINQTTNDVSENEVLENISDEEMIQRNTQQKQRTPATFDTYVNICKTIAAFRKCCPTHHDVDDNFLTELTGFRLLELRASPYSVKRPGNIYQTKRKVNRLVEIANHKIRRVPF
jgi:hypothetical protein